MSLILLLDNGKFIKMIWDNEFYCYGVGFNIIDKIDNIDEGLKVFNVNEHPYWQKLIGKEISEIIVTWDIGQSSKLPQIWELSFSNGNKVWIATFEISENYYWADHLSIFFSKKEVEKYNFNKKTNIQFSVK